MKNFKSRNHQGFGFMEVIAAIFIIGSMLSAVLLLQDTVFSHLFASSEKLGRVLLIKNYLTQAALSREKKEKEPFKDGQTKKIKDPLTTLRYTLKKPSKDSSLKSFESIMIEQGSAEWTELGRPLRETMITFLFKVEKPKQ